MGAFMGEKKPLKLKYFKYKVLSTCAFISHHTVISICANQTAIYLAQFSLLFIYIYNYFVEETWPCTSRMLFVHFHRDTTWWVRKPPLCPLPCEVAFPYNVGTFQDSNLGCTLVQAHASPSDVSLPCSTL